MSLKDQLQINISQQINKQIDRWTHLVWVFLLSDIFVGLRDQTLEFPVRLQLCRITWGGGAVSWAALGAKGRHVSAGLQHLLRANRTLAYLVQTPPPPSRLGGQVWRPPPQLRGLSHPRLTCSKRLELRLLTLRLQRLWEGSSPVNGSCGAGVQQAGLLQSCSSGKYVYSKRVKKQDHSRPTNRSIWLCHVLVNERFTHTDH